MLFIYDQNYQYQVGQIKVPQNDLEQDIDKTYASGIHFFST